MLLSWRGLWLMSLMVQKTSKRKQQNSQKLISVPILSSLHFMKDMAWESTQMEFWVSLLKQALWIEKRTMFGNFTMKESFKSPFFLSACHQVTKTTNHMLYLEDTTPLRSSSVKQVFKLSRTTQYPKSIQPLNLGLSMPRTFSTTVDLCSTVSKPRATQQ